MVKRSCRIRGNFMVDPRFSYPSNYPLFSYPSNYQQFSYPLNYPKFSYPSKYQLLSYPIFETPLVFLSSEEFLARTQLSSYPLKTPMRRFLRNKCQITEPFALFLLQCGSLNFDPILQKNYSRFLDTQVSLTPTHISPSIRR